MRVYEALARAVVEEGVRAVFGLIGDGNMGWYSTLREAPAVDVVAARHESMAVSMAAGYARVTGEPGVAGVTCGPGLTHTATSLRVAALDEIPLVLFAGDSPTTAPGFLQYVDQRRFVEACGASYVSLRSADTAPQDILEAFYLARSQRTPVVFGAPMDLQDQEMDIPWDYQPSRELVPTPQRPHPDPEVVDQVIAAIKKSERPAILLGRGVRCAEVVTELRHLGERIGAVMATTLHAKGQFADDPFSIGIAGAFSSSIAQEVLSEADLVLSFGASLNSYTTEGGTLMPFARYISIDPRPARLRPNPLVDLYVVADGLASARELNRRIDAEHYEAVGFRFAATKSKLVRQTPEDEAQLATPRVDPAAAMAITREHVEDYRAIVCGIGHFWSFPIMGLSLSPDVPLIAPCGFGSIGQALGTSIGVAKAVGGPVLAVDGDGSVMMAIQEMSTAIDIGARITLMILNDGVLGAEYHKLKARGMDAEAARVTEADFAQVARAFGADGMTVTSLEDLREGLHRASGAPGLFVLDVRTSTEGISQPFRRIHYGHESCSPHEPA